MFLAFGLLSYTMFYFFFLEYNKKDWPTTQANIDSVYTYRHDNSVFVMMDYSYSVDGATYQGSDFPLDQYGNEIDFRAIGTTQLNELIVQIRKQDQTSIHYDPNDHEESIIYPTVSYGWIIGGGFCGLVALLSLAGIITALRSRST